MKRKRLAIISATGTARKRTMPAIRDSGICDVVGIHGRDESRLAPLAREYGPAEYSTDAASLLDRVKPDFVFIGSPPHLHREQIQLCLDREIPVLCEKPLALTLEDATAIDAAVTRAGVAVRVAHHLRHQPGVAALRKIIGDAEPGQLRRVSMQWAFWLNELATNATWKLDPSRGGPNAFFDAGIHTIDLMQYLLPEPRRVTALASRGRFDRVFDNVAALILCGETIVEVSTSQSIRHPRNDLVLDFEQFTVVAPHLFSETSLPLVTVTDDGGVRDQLFEMVNPYGEEIKDFVQFLDGATSIATTTGEARQGLAILEAIQQAYLASTTVELN